jgi:phage tail-like protein
MTSLTSAFAALFTAHNIFRFGVFIDDIPVAVFTECRLPSLTVETLPITEGGQNTYIHELPKRVKPGNVTLKSGISSDGALLEWYFQVLTGDLSNAERSVVVMIFDPLGIPISTWSFYRAFPIKYTGPSLNSGDSAVALQELEFVHHGFEVEMGVSLL